jgi:hypothetical protein
VRRPSSHRIPRILGWIAGGLLILLLVAAGMLTVGRPWLVRQVRDDVEQRIENRFGGKVEVGEFTFSVYPSPEIVVEGFKVRKPADGPSQLSISAKRLTADFGLLGLLQDPPRVRYVRLEGLDIEISNRTEGVSNSRRKEAKNRETGEVGYQFILKKVDADGTVLRIYPRNPDADPLEWDMKKLSLHSVGLSRPMVFDTQLINAKPPGLIESSGQFGPWNKDDPGGTPVSGRYTFSNADLSVFGGIAGQLSSEGEYQGELSRIEVRGTTETPDFTVAVGGHPVDLTTEFHAIVDGTNGDTELDPVWAHFRDADILARGSVAKEKGESGKSIRLQVSIRDCPVQDLLFLVLRPTSPPVKGLVTIDTRFVLPPGSQDVVKRLELNGDFSIRSAEFTSQETQSKLEDLSWRARGRPDKEKGDPKRIASNMTSKFSLKKGVARFTDLSFRVPGATVLLNGSSNLQDGELDFRGKLRMDATLSQATGGIKSFFLKLVDPFFKKDGAGAVVPIKIEGSIDEPSFGLDL